MVYKNDIEHQLQFTTQIYNTWHLKLFLLYYFYRYLHIIVIDILSLTFLRLYRKTQFYNFEIYQWHLYLVFCGI